MNIIKLLLLNVNRNILRNDLLVHLPSWLLQAHTGSHTCWPTTIKVTTMQGLISQVVLENCSRLNNSLLGNRFALHTHSFMWTCLSINRSSLLGLLILCLMPLQCCTWQMLHLLLCGGEEVCSHYAWATVRVYWWKLRLSFELSQFLIAWPKLGVQKGIVSTVLHGNSLECSWVHVFTGVLSIS